MLGDLGGLRGDRVRGNEVTRSGLEEIHPAGEDVGGRATLVEARRQLLDLSFIERVPLAVGKEALDQNVGTASGSRGPSGVACRRRSDRSTGRTTVPRNSSATRSSPRTPG